MKTNSHMVLLGYLPLTTLILFDMVTNYRIAVVFSVVSIVILLAVYLFGFPKYKYISTLICSTIAIPFYIISYFVFPKDISPYLAPIVMQLLLLFLNMHLLSIKDNFYKTLGRFFAEDINNSLREDFGNFMKFSKVVILIICASLILVVFNCICRKELCLEDVYIPGSGLIMIGLASIGYGFFQLQTQQHQKSGRQA